MQVIHKTVSDSLDDDSRQPWGGVLQLIGTFGCGGSERVAHNLIVGLKRYGYDSVGVALRQAGGYVENCRDGHEIVELPVRLTRPWTVVRAALALRKLIRDHQVRVIQAHFIRSLLFAILVCRTVRPRPQVWFTWHLSDEIQEGSWRSDRITLWAMRHCDRLFAASQLICDRLNAVSGLNSQVFVNGVPEVAETGGRDADVPLLLWYGRIVPSKNPKALVRAVARLRRQGLRFRVVMAGFDPDFEWFAAEVHEFARELAVHDLIRFPGWVDNTQELLSNSAIGVQVSLSEGLSMSLLEEMMAGLAIVATDVGDTNRAIDDEHTGLLVPPDDDEALYRALRRLIMDRDCRNRLGTAARRKALKSFTLRTMAERVARELNDC